MHPGPAFTIITTYHFPRSDEASYERLLRSLRRSLREVGRRGRVVIVANGTESGAAAPTQVLKDLGVAGPTEIVELAKGTGGPAGSLNAGVEMARAVPLDVSSEWIASVQSSVVLGEGWCAAVLDAGSANQVTSVYGRLVYEDEPTIIWADGHLLSEGLTKGCNYQVACRGAHPPSRGFPCLSAAAFPRATVNSVVDMYGNFVCEKLSHYGDCTDVAVRLDVMYSKPHHVFCLDAVATKRRPRRRFLEEGRSQIHAAGLYYDTEKQGKARSRVLDKRRSLYIDAVRWADIVLAKPYSPRCQQPPSASTALDAEWGR